MKIRPYQKSDKEACLHIFESNRPKYFMAEERQQFIDWLEKPDREAYYVGEINGEIVACGGIYADDKNQLCGLAWGMVNHADHGKGYGKKLSLFRLERMTERYPSYRHELGTSQHTAAFYEKLGFETEEIIKDGFGPGLDHYRMVRKKLTV